MKKICTVLLVLCLFISGLTASAEQTGYDMSRTMNALCPCEDTQTWIDSILIEDAAGSSDLYIIAFLNAGGEYDLTAYVQAMHDRITAGEISNASKRLRALAMLTAVNGALPEYESIADESIGALGIMSYIYGLHYMNNGGTSALWTTETLIDKLLSLQLEDGGWAVKGQYGDIDVTAMCLQALAGSGIEDERTAASIGNALLFLSVHQLDNGGYASYGAENCESCAQVIIALTALNIDPDTDERFIKNGTSVKSAMLSFSNDDGRFSHLRDGDSNELATLQALCALAVSAHPGANLYDFSSLSGITALSAPQSVSFWVRLTWKHWAFAAVALITLLLSGVLLIRKRMTLKKFASLLLCAAIVCAAVALINISSKNEYYSENADSGKAVDGYVTLTIRCDTVAGLGDTAVTPESGVILPETEIPFSNGDTVFDALTLATRKYSIQMEYSGANKAMAYINGINYLYEFDYGDLSGWMYMVNGVMPSVNSGSFALSDGDQIVWAYTTNLGEDLK